MTKCVAITRDGRGDLWAFGNFAEADCHPLVQYGDRIVDGPQSITKRLSLAEIPRIMRRCGRDDLAERVRTCLGAASHPQRVQRVNEYAKYIWTALAESARVAPSDPEELVKLIVRDRKLSIEESKTMEAETPTTAEAATEAPKAKKTKAPKAEGEAAAPKAERFNREHTIRLLSNAEGVKYGPENNPKRAGSASHDRFAMYEDGMTIAAAVEKGVKTEDIAWDVRKGFIEVVA
jgi:hypothetical protein